MLSIILKVFISEKGGRRARVQRDLKMLARLLALKMEKGVLSQGMQVTSRSWKGQRRELSPRDPGRNAALQKLPS